MRQRKDQCRGTGAGSHRGCRGGHGAILITSILWYGWMKVAIEHMQTARAARTAAAAPGIPSNEVSTWMSREFQASLVAVSASAHALDALYGSTVIPQAVRDM